MRLQGMSRAVVLPMLGFGVLALMLATFWTALRPYQGISGDGQLYALQAMAHVHPGRFANDLYFLFGSQDQFTILTAAVAPVYGWLGVDHAAAVLTLFSTLLWAAACYALGRAIAGPRLAWLSLAIAIAEPGWYGGGGEVFQYAEPYFSARLPAEAMLLGALALHISGRPALALSVLTSAFLVHPLMAAPVAGIFVLLTVPVTRWRAVFLAFFVLLAAVLAIAWFAPFGRIRIVDTAWLGVIERRSWFLLVSHWRHSDWLRAVVPIASLVAAAGILKGTPAGGLAKATIAVCLAGLATSYVAGDLMPVAIVMQSQPWRTLWVTTLVAVVLLPAMCQSAWSGSLLERASSLVLISAWLDVSSDAAAPLAVLSVALAYWPRTHDPRVVKLLTKGAWAILVVSAVFGLVGALDAAVNLPTLGPIMAGRLELLRNVARYVAPTLACLATTWYLCTLRPSAVGVGIAAAFTLMLGAAVMPAAAGQFWARTYTGPQYDEFASWRGRIPEGVNVMWIGNPTATWLLLERPSYVSVHQLAGVVFSRDMALEGADRAARVSAIQDPSRTFGESPRTDLPGRPLTLQSLHDVCRDSGVGFVVSGKSLSTKIATGHWPDRSRDVFLYDCNSQQTPSISRP